MADKKEITGRWWIHGKRAPALGGVLSQEGGRLRLKIVNNTGGESVGNMLNQGAQVGMPAIPKVIEGKDSENKPVYLFGCTCDKHNLSQGQETYKISALAGVQGCKIESWDKPVVKTVFVRLQHLHRWLDADALERITLPDGKTGYRESGYSALHFPIAEGIVLHITQSSQSTNGQDGHHFKPDCKVCLSFATPRSLDEVCGTWVHWVSHFFSLLVGTNLLVEEIVVSDIDAFSSDKSGIDFMISFLQRGTVLGRTGAKSRSRLSNPNSYDMPASYSTVKDKLGSMLKQWYTVSKRLEAVVGLFTSVVFHHALHSTAEFLFLVQALEVYHTRCGRFDSHQIPPDVQKKMVKEILKTVPAEHADWVRKKISSNYKYLNERLLDVFQANQDIAGRLFKDVNGTAEKIGYTRNHYTHYTSDTNHAKFIDEEEMAVLNFSLEHFVWALLLREIGAPESAVDKIISTAESVNWTSLKPSKNPQESGKGCLGIVLLLVAPIGFVAASLFLS